MEFQLTWVWSVRTTFGGRIQIQAGFKYTYLDHVEIPTLPHRCFRLFANKND